MNREEIKAVCVTLIYLLIHSIVFFGAAFIFYGAMKGSYAVSTYSANDWFALKWLAKIYGITALICAPLIWLTIVIYGREK